MVLLESEKISMGTLAPDFSLMGIDGKTYNLESFKKANLLLVVFMCNHCPYVQAIWGRLVDLQARFRDSGLQVVGINPNIANSNYEEETLVMMKDYAQRYGADFPYLADEDQSVAKAYGAQCTPDIYLYDGDRKLFYHGRLDDNWKDEAAVEKHDLAEAIDSALNGTAVGEQKPSMGCSIKWL